jgi:EpsI family protein
VFRSYQSDSTQPVGLYVAYYSDPREGAQIHSPLHCYPGAGWKVLRSEPLRIRDLQGVHTRMQRLLVAKDDRHDVVVYWYDTRTGRLTSDLELKLNLMRTALLHRPQDAAFVRWSTPMDPGESLDDATQRLLATVARAYPELQAALPFGG